MLPSQVFTEWFDVDQMLQASQPPVLHPTEHEWGILEGDSILHQHHRNTK